jgi:hypothetical protein
MNAIRAWLREYWRTVAKYAGIVAIAVAGTILVMANFFAHRQELGVEVEWNNAISRLGIEPVFPPEEDIYVGDVFAVVTIDRGSSEGKRLAAPLKRMIKIYSFPMAAVLAEYYNSTPLFTVTTAKPDKDESPWTRSERSGGVFAPTDKRGFLALAAFPEFTIRQSRSASGGLAGLGSLGSSWFDNDLVEVKIPLAETYGVPSLVAIALFDKLCDGILADICTDKAIRRQLTHVAGDAVEAWEVDPKTKKLKYLLDVELIFVNRVYLARAIEQRRVVDRKGAADVAIGKGAPDKPSDAAATEEEKKQPTDVKADQALQQSSQALKQLAELRKQLDKIGTGGAAHSEYVSDNSVVLKRIFERPVVIGYRAVRKKFDYDLNKLNNPKPQPQDKAP